MKKLISLALSVLLALAIFAAAENLTTDERQSEDARSRYELACYYYTQERDYEKAAEWMRSAADLGEADAAYELGKYYYTGQGVERDTAKALEWWEKAAELGCTAAINRIGYMYQTGDGVEADAAMAVRYYIRAAEFGDAEAPGTLGYCYTVGLGVEKDESKALEYYRLGAERGDAYASNQLGMYYYENGDYANALIYLQEAAEDGNTDAQYAMGYMYCNGVGVGADVDAAREWWTLAAQNGNIAAISAIYYLSADENGVATVQPGDTGDTVTELQTALIAIGYLAGNPTGTYDDATQSAVRLFQEAHALEGTGIADPLTQAFISFQDLTPYAARIAAVSLQNAANAPRLFVAFANAGDRAITKIVFNVLPLNANGEPMTAFDFYDTITCESDSLLEAGATDEKGFYWALDGCKDVCGVKLAISAVTFADGTEATVPAGALNWIPFTADL